MWTVESQEQADRLNDTGTTPPYVAWNGHTMVAPLNMPEDEDADRSLSWHERRREYRVGDRISYRSASAHCVPSCLACRSGEELPDW